VFKATIYETWPLKWVILIGLASVTDTNTIKSMKPIKPQSQMTESEHAF